MPEHLFQTVWVWSLPLLVVFYIIPLLSLVLLPLEKRIRFGGLHSFVGHIELFLAFFRDGLIAPLLLVYAGYAAMHWGFSYLSLLALGFFGLSVWGYLSRRRRLKRFLDFMVGHFVLEPNEFLRLYYASISGLPGRLPPAPSEILKLPLDYSTGDTRVSFGPVIPGLISTGIIARLVVRAARWRGAAFCRDAADVLAATWGARVVQLAEAKMEVEDVHHLENIFGRTIFVSNHKSFLDFAVIPLVIGLINRERGESFRPRYMAARDHFRDNFFLYRVVGIGKALEKSGAVFVDRKLKKARAVQAVDDAVRTMIEDAVDIVMYPQGTRAYGNRGVDGRRFDAGYYTTGSKEGLMKERGHIKKGAAYLAVDVASALSRSGVPLNIVPVGLFGTATVVPRGKIRVQKGVKIKAVFGGPLTLGAEEMRGLVEKDPGSSEYIAQRKDLVEEIFVKIDEMLKGILHIHEGLRKRLVVDIRKKMREEEVEKFFEALEAWKDDEDLIFSIIDCIYSLPPKVWKSYLHRLVLLLNETDTDREEVLGFKKMIVGEMIKNRN